MTEPIPDMSQTHEPTDKQIEDLLLSAEEMHQTYGKLAEQGVDTNVEPLVFVKSNLEKQLVYLGVHHSEKPDRPDLERILAAWREFLEETRGKDRVVLIEGGLRPVGKDQDTAIASWGEPGLLAYLADKDGVELATPEPNRKQELLAVTEAVGRDEAIYYYFARTLRQWQRINTTESFEKYVSSYLKNYQKLLEWDDSDFSVEHMMRLYEQKHGQKFDATKPVNPADASPGYNLAATTCSQYRNIHMVKEIVRLWDEGKSIFIIYGSGHLITQEKSLKELLG